MDAMILVFWMLSFKPTFSLSSLTFIRRLFSSSPLSSIMVVLSPHLRFLIFLPAILIPSSPSSCLSFHMMYSPYKLNKQDNNIQPWCTPFPIWNQSVSMSSSNCCFLICMHISKEAGQVLWYFHLLMNFPVCCDPVKGFGIANKAEVDVFLKITCFFDDPMDVGNLISGSSAFSKSSLNIWKFTVHVLLKPGLENFENYFTSVWDESNCAVVWVSFGIAFLWDWNENWPFPVLWPLLSFPNSLTYWVQHFHRFIF